MECIICWTDLKKDFVELNCLKKHKLCNSCYKQSSTFLEDKLSCPSDTTKVDTVKIFKSNNKPKLLKLIKKQNQNNHNVSNIGDLRNNLDQCKNIFKNF